MSNLGYRSKLNFTWESIQHAANTPERLKQFVERLRDYESRVENGGEMAQLIRRTEEEFKKEMDNDLNTPATLAALFNLMGKLNLAMEEGSLSTGNAKAAYELLLRLDRVLGILTLGEKEELQHEVEVLIEEREKARKVRDFQRADEIRRNLKEMGIVLEDTKEGVRWRRK